MVLHTVTHFYMVLHTVLHGSAHFVLHGVAFFCMVLPIFNGAAQCFVWFCILFQ